MGRLDPFTLQLPEVLFTINRHCGFHESFQQWQQSHVRDDAVRSDIYSTDTHGYSEAIFGTTHLLGFSYAPRIKNLKKQSLYLFRSRKKEDRSDWLIIPNKYINDSPIREHWDDLLRLIATIKLKETTASDIFRRLNSYSKQHSLYQDSQSLRPDHQVAVHPALHRRPRTPSGN